MTLAETRAREIRLAVSRTSDREYLERVCWYVRLSEQCSDLRLAFWDVAGEVIALLRIQSEVLSEDLRSPRPETYLVEDQGEVRSSSPEEVFSLASYDWQELARLCAEVPPTFDAITRRVVREAPGFKAGQHRRAAEILVLGSVATAAAPRKEGLRSVLRKPGELAAQSLASVVQPSFMRIALAVFGGEKKQLQAEDLVY